MYYETNYAGVGLMVFFALLGLALFILLMEIIIGSGTKKYRRQVTDLYVAGKIRQLAEEDKIDLAEEYEIYKKWKKKERMQDKPLDDTVEMELQDRITENKKE